MTHGVTAPGGFRASGVAAGLKQSGNKDVALIVNDGPLQVAAGVFTSNRIKAAPVLWTQQCLTTGELHAVAMNSGGANACTGPEGFADTHHTAEHVAELLDCGPDRGRRLLHGTDRRAAPDGSPCSPGSPWLPMSCRPIRARGRRGDHDHGHGRQGRHRDRVPGSPSAGWPKAPACSRRAWPRCCRS